MKVFTSEQAMALAVELARKGMGRTSPNPPVGAVVLDAHGRLLSQGWHQKCGGDHAEIMAVKNISSSDLKNASLYVTLEPCSHQGKTPPCVNHLAELPFSKICIGLKDPNPLVFGAGIQKLKQSGIKVEMYKGPLKEQLEELIEIFSFNIKEKKPFTALKIASSLDGSIKAPDRRWITNTFSRQHVALLRGYYDAVCIGAKTFLEDNPRLNSRHPQFSDKENKVILLDPDGLCFTHLPNSHLVKVRNPDKVIVVTRPSSQKRLGPWQVIEQEGEGLFDLENLLQTLFHQGICSILVEGGGEVFSSFLKYSQRLYLFLAPLLTGQKGKVNWCQKIMHSSLELSSISSVNFKEDLFITGRFPQ